MIDRRMVRSHVRGQSKIERDPELQQFVDELLPHGTFAEIAEECRKRFGPQRAPGKSSIHAYFRKHQERLLQGGGWTIVDEPSIHAPLAVWRSFIARLEAIDPQDAGVRLSILHAHQAVSLKLRAEGGDEDGAGGGGAD